MLVPILLLEQLLGKQGNLEKRTRGKNMNTAKKIKYHKPQIDSENLFNAQMGGIGLFYQCFCNAPGSVLNNNHKDAKRQGT